MLKLDVRIDAINLFVSKLRRLAIIFLKHVRMILAQFADSNHPPKEEIGGGPLPFLPILPAVRPG